MALDPPLTSDEEALVLLVRSLQAKQQEVVDAEQSAADSTVQANAARTNMRNLRDEFADQMRRRGITNPEAILRSQGRDR